MNSPNNNNNFPFEGAQPADRIAEMEREDSDDFNEENIFGDFHKRPESAPGMLQNLLEPDPED